MLGVPGRYIMRFIASILNHIKVLLCLVCREEGEREKGKEGGREGVLCMLREGLYLWYCIHLFLNLHSVFTHTVYSLLISKGKSSFHKGLWFTKAPLPFGYYSNCTGQKVLGLSCHESIPFPVRYTYVPSNLCFTK